MIKRLIIIFVLINSLCINTFAHIKPEDVSVTDYSGVISQGVKDYIKSKNTVLFDKTGAKIIFVTTDLLNGLSPNEYAKSLYSSWNIDKLGRGNSVFVVISPNTKDYGITQGNNIKRVLTDDILYSKVLDDFEPYFSSDNIDVAVMSLYNSLGKWYEENYNGLSLNLDENIKIYLSGEKYADEDINPSNLWMWIGGGVILVMAVVFLSIKRNIDINTRQNERRIKRKRNKADIDKIVNS